MLPGKYKLFLRICVLINKDQQFRHSLTKLPLGTLIEISHIRHRKCYMCRKENIVARGYVTYPMFFFSFNVLVKTVLLCCPTCTQRYKENRTCIIGGRSLDIALVKLDYLKC